MNMNFKYEIMVYILSISVVQIKYETVNMKIWNYEYELL